jgi:Fe-S-cluster containining protein
MSSRANQIPVLPAARSALELARASDGKSGYIVRDLESGQKVGLDPLGAAVLAELEVPRAAASVLASLSKRFQRPVPPAHLYSRLVALARNYLLEGPRSQAFLARALNARQRAESVPRAQRPLVFFDDMRHACQACGGCCSGADVGPLPQPTVDRIASHDWSARVGALPDGSPKPLFRKESVAGKEVWLTALDHGACVFLNEDKLCRVHAELGEDAKPTICKQFPFHFTATPDGNISVTIQLECRSWLRAKRAARHASQHERELRKLLELGAFVQEVREPVEVSPGFPMSWAEYSALESSLRAAVEAGSVTDATARASSLVRRVVDDYERELAHHEPWLDPSVWRAAYAEFEAPRALTAAEARARLAERVVEAALGGAEEFDGRADPLRAEMHRFFGLQVQGALLSELHASWYRQPTGALDEVLRDAWSASLGSREALFYRDFTAGLGAVALRDSIVRAGAVIRARNAARVEVLEQDAVDSLVIANKMLRQWSVSAVLQGLPEALRRSFVFVDPESA